MWSVAGRGSRQTSAPKHRERHVFLNLDATAASLTMCRLLFAPLQTPSAGTTCVSTSRRSPTTCAAPERQPSHAPSDHAQLLTQLQKGAAAANAKKLVLAMGGGALDTSNSSAYQEIVSKFLVEGWHVEIHAWLRALDDGYLRLQSHNPGERWSSRWTKCSTTAAHSKAAWGVDMSGNAFLKEQDQHQHSLHTSSWEELNAGDLIGNEAAIAKWGLKTWVDAG
ncbi:hypothetical protein PRIC1_007086 [Phytophthora ramorum]